VRRLLLFLALTTLLIPIIGCGSHRSQTVTTGGSGSLEGVQIIPRDDDLDVPVETWIRVYWPSGFEPPAEFTFTLRDGSDTRVPTYKHNSRQENDWQFEPSEILDYDTRYKIEVEAGDERVVTYFWTEEEGYRAPLLNVPSDAGPRVSGPLVEHRVQTAY